MRPLILIAVVVCLCARVSSAQAVQADRVGPERTGATTRLSGHVPRWAIPQNDAGAVLGTQPLQLTFVLARSAEKQAAFDQMLQQVETPGSSRYHQWLTPAQVGEQFGPTQHDVQALTSWLAGRGMGEAQVTPSRMFVTVRTTVSIAEPALGTEVRRFRTASGTHLAATQDPALPSELATIVQGVDGLSDELVSPNVHALPPVPMSTTQSRTMAARPEYTYSSTVHYITPDDFATIYDMKSSYSSGYYGTGQRIAIVGRSQVNATDISNFESVVERGNNLPAVVLATGQDPGYTGDGDQAEATLDVSRVAGTAPLAQVDLVLAPVSSGGITSAAQYAVNTLNDPILNVSFGACELSAGASAVLFWDSLFAQAAAQGISVFVSAGDSGAAGCDSSGVAAPAVQTASINYLCSSSHVTCVGGTELIDEASPSLYWNTSNDSLDGSAKGYIPEGAWNDPLNTSTGAYVVFAGGGGASRYIAKPSWQSGAGVPSDGFRDVPDVSFPASAHDGYYTCYALDGGGCGGSGSFISFYGTSASTPSMAAIAALVNQRTGTRQGNLNPLLYRLAASNSAVLHDATVQTSSVLTCSVPTPSPCNNSTPGPSSLSGGLAGYLLTSGYDLATGLGSLDVGQLLSAVGSAQASTSLTLASIPSSALIGTNITFTATVATSGGGTPGGSVQFMVNGNPFGAAAPVVAGTASLTTSFATDTSGTLGAYYSGDANFAPSVNLQGTTFSVHKMYPVLAIAPGNVSISVVNSLGYTVTVSGSGALPTGTVSLLREGSTNTGLGSFPLVNGVAMVPAITFTPGVWDMNFTYGGDANYEGQSATVVVQAAGVPSSVTLTASATTVSPPQTVAFIATVSGSSNAAPTGTVQLWVNGLPAGSVVALAGSTGISLPSPALSAGDNNVYAVYSGDTLYAASNSPAAVIHNVGFTIAGNTTVINYQLSSGTSSTLTLNYVAGGGFGGAVTQSCAIAPTTANTADPSLQCAFSPATVALATNGTGSSLISITSVASRAVTGQHMTMWRFVEGYAKQPVRAALPCGAVFVGLLLVHRRRDVRGGRRLLSVALAAAGLALLGPLAACGGGGGGTASAGATSAAVSAVGSYNVTVTGTSGVVVATHTFLLNVY